MNPAGYPNLATIRPDSGINPPRAGQSRAGGGSYLRPARSESPYGSDSRPKRVRSPDRARPMDGRRPILERGGRPR